jgi:hypothetical protein
MSKPGQRVTRLQGRRLVDMRRHRSSCDQTVPTTQRRDLHPSVARPRGSGRELDPGQSYLPIAGAANGYVRYLRGFRIPGQVHPAPSHLDDEQHEHPGQAHGSTVKKSVTNRPPARARRNWHQVGPALPAPARDHDGAGSAASAGVYRGRATWRCTTATCCLTAIPTASESGVGPQPDTPEPAERSATRSYEPPHHRACRTGICPSRR